MHPNATGKKNPEQKCCLSRVNAGFSAGGGTDSHGNRKGHFSFSLPSLLPSSLQGLAGQERVGSRSPPPAALPPFTAVAPGPIPAELHHFGALGLLTALAWFQSGPSTNFSILLVMESRRERNESFPIPLVIERRALLCQCNV